MGDPSYAKDVPALDGMPPGWKGIERQYVSGSYAGKFYVRWHSLDGRHRSILSPNKVIEIHCRETGENLATALKAYEDAQTARKDKEKESRAKEREERGLLKGQQREEAIEEFRVAFGSLAGPIVHAFPGWRTRWDYQPNCNQVRVTYIDTLGKEWGLLKDIEGMLGNKMKKEEGEVATLMASAVAAQNPGEFSQGSATCKVSASGTFESDGPSKPGEVSGKWKNRMEKSNLIEERESRPDDFADSQLVVTAAASGAAAARQLSAAGAPDGETLAASAAGIRQALVARGIPAATGLVAVFEHRMQRKGPSEDPLGGIYHELPVEFNGRPCYQKVQRSTKRARVLECQEVFMFWGAKRARWKLAHALDDRLAGYAFCSDNAPRPSEAKGPWQTVRCSRRD